MVAREQYRDVELRARNMQLTHTIAIIPRGLQNSHPATERQSDLSHCIRDKTIRLNAYRCLLSTCGWLEFLLHHGEHVKSSQVFVLQVSDMSARPVRPAGDSG